MKTLLYLFVLMSFTVNAQNKHLTKTGVITFEASVPSFEEIAATNNSVTAIFDADTGKFAVLALVKGFRFKNALMEAHFNENYVASDLYPKAKFKGTIEGFSLENFDHIKSDYEINGTLEFHGKVKQIESCLIRITNLDTNGLHMIGSLEVKTSDYSIEIPKIVRKKVSDIITINFEFNLIKT
ncbi:hypothetical protein A9Q87_05025 [Flavobacteriales bacterium 34_180_T64]|nr:hypothetical protein A9Q87_05025 [Flavobacteriales bacterium 34_180_T64]